LQSVIIHSANGGKGEGWHVEEYSVALTKGNEIQFVPHRNHITSTLQNESDIQFVPHRNHITSPTTTKWKRDSVCTSQESHNVTNHYKMEAIFSLYLTGIT
jgi:hypothetical protein